MNKIPVIGLNMSSTSPENGVGGDLLLPGGYMDAVERAGGIPLCIPPYADLSAIGAILPLLDGFLFIGGLDYRPAHYGGHDQPEEELMDARRDRFDIALAGFILQDTLLPVLGICGGHQLLAITRGGALIQDIRTEWVPPQGGSPLTHAKQERSGPEAAAFLHPLRIRENSLIAKATGTGPEETLTVNSFHHQAVHPDRIGQELCATAWSADGIIEAIEPALESHWARSGRFLLGVQWHPERMADRPSESRLFRSLIEAAAGMCR